MSARTKAPSVSFKSAWVDQRAKLVGELDQAHPEYVHCFQSSDVDSEELISKDLEMVYRDTYDKGEGHEVLKWRNDSVARIPRALWEAHRAAQCEESASDVQSLYCRPENNESWKDNAPGRRIASPKDPNQIGNTGGM